MNQAYTKRTGSLTRYWAIETNPEEPINLIHTASKKDHEAAPIRTQYKTYESRAEALLDAERLIEQKLARGYKLEQLKREKKEKPKKTIPQDVSLSRKKLELLRSIYSSDLSVRELRRELKPVTDPVFLHYLAWVSGETLISHDVGFEWPKSILLHPYCDAGTALMIYWFGNPEYAYSVEPDDWQRPNRRDLKRIETAYLDETFQSQKISFDPTPYLPKPMNRSVIRRMPYGMTLPSKGRVLSPLRIENRKGDYVF